MPWRGPVKGSPLLADQFPSLGWHLADRLDDLFPWMPRTDEQVLKLVNHYRLDPKTGQRAVRRSQFMGPKGSGKSPEAFTYAVAELCLEVIPDGWDADGEPVGRPWSKPTPLIQIAAVSLDQTDNTYGAGLELLGENDGQAADILGLDVGDTRILRRSNHRARIDKVTASAGAREGQPTVFGVLDESHLWLPSNGGQNLARTIRRNVGKMGGSSLETTNAYDPNIGSVAQRTDEAVQLGEKGLYQWNPQAPHVVSLANRAETLKALRLVYKDCSWVDLGRLWAEMQDPDTTESDNRRFYLNEVWAGSDAAWTKKTIEVLVASDDNPVRPLERGDRVTLGFDGSRYNDATALVAVRVEDRHMAVLGLWEQPSDDDDWEVPADEVEDAITDAHERFKVLRAYADPPYWREDVDRWCGRWDVWKKWETARRRAMAYSVRSMDELIRASGCTIEADPLSDGLVRHLVNTQKRTLSLRDDEGRFLWTVGKKAPKSPLKIDAAVAAILAQEAAGDAIAAGALKKRSSSAVFV